MSQAYPHPSDARPGRADRLRSRIAWLIAIGGLASIGIYSGVPQAPANNQVASKPSGDIVIEVDATRTTGPISPLIYGLATGNPDTIRQLRVPLTRIGGNPATRYNWKKGNCWNAARDWGFRNGAYGRYSKEDSQPSGVADQEIAGVRSLHADVLLTIPTMGWVARDNNNGTQSVGVPPQGGPPAYTNAESIAGYDPSENRLRVSVPSLPRKGRPFSDPPDPADDNVYQDEWVYHLARRFGKADAGGVRYYAMDNEPDLWDFTHTDMHPVQADYDEVLQRFLNTATAIKDVDPSAQITGPVVSGWLSYFFSGRDRGNDNYRSHPDRQAHGGVAFLPWFLRQVAEHDRKTGRRTLDVLDVHYYPQAGHVYAGGSDPATNAVRLSSTRSLWDPTYTDESWIQTSVQLLPRLRQWVDTCYPGTKIALTEWNWGAGATMNGGLATAEVLGILGREHTDMACLWTEPPPHSPAFFAYKIFRDADGNGNGFGDSGLAAHSSAPDYVSCFAAQDASGRTPTILLINKMPDAPASVSLHLQSEQPESVARIFRYSAEHPESIVRLQDVALHSGRISLSLPAYSITLLRCDAQANAAAHVTLAR